jgi:hypothetical protein
LYTKLGLINGLRLEGFQRQSKRGQLLTKLIMQLARDPSALVFLRNDESRQQLSTLLLDTLTFRDLCPKGFV